MLPFSETKKPTQRFSNRVENYVKYRPGYPQELPEFLKSNLGFTQDWVVADIGSGTGISTEMFLSNGNRVFAVEPNKQMLDASIDLLSRFPDFLPLNATAENTGIESDAVDLVFAAQSFHWFDSANAPKEMRRILKAGGFIGLVWNERELDINRFHIDYEEFLTRFADDYEAIRHDSIGISDINAVFETKFEETTFRYEQVFDFEGLLGRVLSSSYMPDEGSESFPEMSENLNSLFAKHQEFGKITVSYKTKFYYKNF